MTISILFGGNIEVFFQVAVCCFKSQNLNFLSLHLSHHLFEIFPFAKLSPRLNDIGFNL